MSFTTTSNDEYSSGPFNWVVDSGAWVHSTSNCLPGTNLGIFCKGNVKNGNNIDAESHLFNIDRKINKCGHDVQVFDNTEFTEPEDSVKRMYTGEHTGLDEDFLYSHDTRMKKSCNLAGIHIDRFDYLQQNHQTLDRIFFPEDTRGGLNSRILHKDNYNCPSHQERGGNR